MKKIRFYAKKYYQFAMRFFKKCNEIIHSSRVKAIIAKVPGNRTMKSYVANHRLLFGIAGAVAISLSLTVFSLVLYVVTGTSKLDLSRPGYEEVRQRVEKTPLRENAFEPNGTLDNKIINDYLKKYKKQSQTLNKYDTFDPHLLDDAPLGLTSPQQTAPSSSAP